MRIINLTPHALHMNNTKTYTIFSTCDGLGGAYQNGPLEVTCNLSRIGAARHIAGNHEHHADCIAANERLVWDGEGVMAEPLAEAVR